MKRNITKTLALMLVMALVLSFASVASAASSMYATQDTTIYTGPGTGTAVKTLAKGDKITTTGTSINNWIQVRYDSYSQGYVNGNHLSYYRTGGSSSGSSSSGSAVISCSTCYGSSATFKVCGDCGDIYYATANVNVRSGPSTSYSRIGSLSKNQQVTRIGKSGNWYKVLTNDGRNAYVSASYLKPVGSSSSSSSSDSSVSYGTYYTTTGLNVRKGAGTGYSVLDTLSRGEAVTYLGQRDGNWYKIRTKSGVVGWCHGGYLTAGSAAHYCNTCYKPYYGSNCSTCYNPPKYCNNCWHIYYGTRCTYCYDDDYYWGYYGDIRAPRGIIKIGRNYCVRGNVDMYDVTLEDGTTTKPSVELRDGTSVRVLGIDTSNRWRVKVRVTDTYDDELDNSVGYVMMDDLRYY